MEDVTHAFMDLAKAGVKVDLEVFTNAGIPCLKPEFIASYLMENPAPRPQNFYIPELQHLNKTYDILLQSFKLWTWTVQA